MDVNRLIIYDDRSCLIRKDGEQEEFVEGSMNEEAKRRYDCINEKLSEGYFEKLVDSCINNEFTISEINLKDSHYELINSLVNSISSDHGRAVIGLLIVQLTIKSISSSQNIRLHKGSNYSHHFSWSNGISMRSIDSKFITPILRKYDLLKINKDGVMMTRTLAENYPYTKLYKARVKGEKLIWLELIDLIESDSINSLNALKYIIFKLINKADDFKRVAEEAIEKLNIIIDSKTLDKIIVKNLINNHIEKSNYAARLMEISLHSLIQALEENDELFNYLLSPLTQMRSANKKHGNIGDIEIMEYDYIIEAWDAKYGKNYLRDEIEELKEKLLSHSNVKKAGFILSEPPIRMKEIQSRINEIEKMTETTIEIHEMTDWIDIIFNKSDLEEKLLAKLWLEIYVHSLAQRRRNKAPIDEPCFKWLEIISKILDEYTFLSE